MDRIKDDRGNAFGLAALYAAILDGVGQGQAVAHRLPSWPPSRSRASGPEGSEFRAVALPVLPGSHQVTA